MEPAGETKTHTSAETATETKETTTETQIIPVSFYTNLLPRSDHISPSVFANSVRLSKEGIQRNKYNHHKGDPATRPPCLHERCSNWKLGICADCNADLGPERLAQEEQRGRKNKIEDHLPLVDLIATAGSNMRVTHATLGQGTLQE